MTFLVLRRTIHRFGRERTAEAAAGIAFFGLFSLFPLLLILVGMGSSILHLPQAQDQVLHTLMEAFPFSVDIVEENVQKVLNKRNTSQIFGWLGLAWSATGAFTVLTRNINRAWPDADRHNYIKMRLMAFSMLAGMVVVTGALLAANLLIRFLPLSWGGIASLFVSLRYFSHAVIWLLTLITLLWLYRWIPNTEVLWSEAAWGGVLASTGTVLATSIFSWYLGSGRGLTNYNLVYGSLGTIVALMFWIYILSFIVLFGAHLSSSIAYYTRKKSEPGAGPNS
ncbi:MAG: YihY/virulence factor BrkB family protein [Anaerolineales bacterium]|nr:YihY/virulence factor BrkB family protein [Anaerolineales bacterium]